MGRTSAQGQREAGQQQAAVADAVQSPLVRPCPADAELLLGGTGAWWLAG